MSPVFLGLLLLGAVAFADELDFLRQDPKVFDIIADVSNQKGDAMQVIGQILCDISHGIEDPSGKEKMKSPEYLKKGEELLKKALKVGRAPAIHFILEKAKNILMTKMVRSLNGNKIDLRRLSGELGNVCKNLISDGITKNGGAISKKYMGNASAEIFVRDWVEQLFKGQ